MKVLVFSTDDFLHPAGGAELAFKEISSRCPDISFDLVCARLRRDASRVQTVGNVTIHRIGFGITWLDGALLGLFGARYGLRLHRTAPYDLVWAILASYGGFAATQFKRVTAIPYLLTLQEGTDTRILDRRTMLLGPLFGNIFRRADGLQAISSYLLAWGKRRGFVGTIARVIPNGVAYAQFHDASSVSRDDSGITLLSISRFVPKNGLTDLIDALALMSPRVRLVLAGDGPLRPKLEAQIHRLHLEDRVKLEGFVRHQHTPELLKSADIFIRPSISEGLGTAFLEAMAAGLPVIGTAVGGIPDFLTDGVTGLVCKPNNPTDIAQAVQRFLDMSEDQRNQIRDRAATMVRERFSWDGIAANMRQIFSTLCPNA